MGLSNSERLILYRLHEVLSGLSTSKADAHRRAMHVLQHGLEDIFPEDLEAVRSKAPNLEAGKFVREALELYHNLQFSFHRLHNTERDLIRERDVLFPGFCQREESDHFELAQVFLGQLAMWPGFRLLGRLDSGVPMIATYERMLATAKSCAFDNRRGYSGKNVRKIVAAAKALETSTARTSEHPKARPSSPPKKSAEGELHAGQR